MLISAPLPDEFYLGHIGRLSFINSRKSDEELINYVKNYLSLRPVEKRVTPPVVAISSLVKIRVIDYIDHHTLFHFNWLIRDHNKLDYEYRWPYTELKDRVTLQRREGAYYCQQCQAEDIHFWGYSYWRRSHQMPGNHWCEKHDDHLLTHVSEENAFTRTPSYWQSQNLYQSASHAKACRDSRSTQKFVSGCFALLEAKEKLNFNAIYKAIGVQLERFPKLRSLETQDPKYFRDYLLNTYPKKFLLEAFPDLIEKNSPIFFYKAHLYIRPRRFGFVLSGEFVLFAILVFGTIEAFVEMLNECSMIDQTIVNQ
jgi:hypothetical protein